MKALICDCDGVLVDTERDGHRVAFNQAFARHQLGVEWDVDLYGELLKTYRKRVPSNTEQSFTLSGGDDWEPFNTPYGRVWMQICKDMDGDGYNEVLACMDNDVVSQKFVVLDGQTGTVDEQYDYPAAEAHDTIIIANLSGNDRPSDIVLKDRYDNLWAMNRDWTLLFTHTGNLGHYP